MPIQLSKPHEGAGAFVVDLGNPTAGLLADDRIEWRVAVESDAWLLLTAPRANRARCVAGAVAPTERRPPPG